MAKSHFNVDAEPARDTGPKRLSYPCWADRCPMPGTIFTGGPDSRGACSWHYGQTGDAVGTVTRQILDWDCVQLAINRGRHVLTDKDTLADVKKQNEALGDAWAAMVPAVLGSGWKPRLEPKRGEHYGEWIRRLERFLANRVKEALKPGLVILDDCAPTPTVADMRARLRGALPSTLGSADWDGP